MGGAAGGHPRPRTRPSAFASTSQRFGDSTDAAVRNDAYGVVMARYVRALHPIAATTVAGLVFAQVYLIAAFIFGEAGALDVHRTVGRIAVVFELLVLVTALVAFRNDRAQLWLSGSLFVVGALQASLAKDLGSSPWVHALHGALALAVLLLASAIAISTWREILPLGRARLTATARARPSG
jgi:hypothetical protein